MWNLGMCDIAKPGCSGVLWVLPLVQELRGKPFCPSQWVRWGPRTTDILCVAVMLLQQHFQLGLGQLVVSTSRTRNFFTQESIEVASWTQHTMQSLCTLVNIPKTKRFSQSWPGTLVRLCPVLFYLSAVTFRRVLRIRFHVRVYAHAHRPSHKDLSRFWRCCTKKQNFTVTEDYFCLQETQTVDQNCVALDEDRLGMAWHLIEVWTYRAAETSQTRGTQSTLRALVVPTQKKIHTVAKDVMHFFPVFLMQDCQFHESFNVGHSVEAHWTYE